MNYSISNIAWDKSDDLQVATILREQGIKFIDIAPTIFQDIINNYDLKKFSKMKNFWNSQDINFHSMQSLLYGMDKFTIFDRNNHKILLEHLNKNIEIAELLGIKNLIFGSPKNRRYITKNKSENQDVALEFFNKVSYLLMDSTCQLSIEPNPIEYGADFGVTSIECLEFIKLLSKDNIGIHLDIGSIKMTNENLDDLLDTGRNIINSIHISEPFLSKIQDKKLHLNSSQSIKRKFKFNFLNIEIASSSFKNINELENNLIYIKSIYDNRNYNS